MLQGNSIALMAGIGIAVLLLWIGIAIGKRIARKAAAGSTSVLEDDERERLLEMLHELASWTNEYSGNVSDYQDRLGQLSQEVRTAADSESGDRGVAENRVIVLLQQIMQSNDQLKKRLDDAERQLEKQTKQIECYLTEARTDGLTGLYNRRAFDQRMEELFVSYRGGGRSFVVVLIDIDRFKSINDTHGHQAGDQVLQQLAACLRTQLESAIIVARFGGEEFAALMDGPLRFAAERMNEIRRQVSKMRMDAGDTQLEISISVGLSEPREDIVVGPILRRADEALYAAKNMGRDRVYYHDGRGTALVGAPEVARS